MYQGGHQFGYSQDYYSYGHPQQPQAYGQPQPQGYGQPAFYGNQPFQQQQQLPPQAFPQHGYQPVAQPHYLTHQHSFPQPPNHFQPSQPAYQVPPPVQHQQQQISPQALAPQHSHAPVQQPQQQPSQQHQQPSQRPLPPPPAPPAMPQKQFAQSAPQLHVAPSVQPAAGHSFSRPPPARPAAPQQRPLQQTFGSHRGQSHSSALAPASVSNGNWPTDIVVVSAQAKVRALQVDEGSRSCKVLWEHSLASAVSSFLGGALHLDTLVADDSCVYVASRGRVRCFDVVSGIARWEEEPEGLNKGIFGAYDLAFMSAVGDVLLVTAANMLVCLKKVNGVQVWAMPLDFMVKRDCFVLCLLYGNRVAVASLGWIACYDLQSGQLAWKNKLEGQRYGKMSLAVTTDGNLVSGGAGFLTLINPDNGQTIVVHNLKGTGYNNVALYVHEDLVFAATFGQITCHSARNLNQLWINSLKGMSYNTCQSIEVENDRVFVGQNGRICAMEMRTGQTLWMSDKIAVISGATTLAHWKNGLILSSTGKLQCLSVNTGDLMWEDNLPSMGHGPVCLATHCDYTNYNSSTLLQALEEARDQRRRRHNNN